MKYLKLFERFIYGSSDTEIPKLEKKALALNFAGNKDYGILLHFLRMTGIKSNNWNPSNLEFHINKGFGCTFITKDRSLNFDYLVTSDPYLVEDLKTGKMIKMEELKDELGMTELELNDLLNNPIGRKKINILNYLISPIGLT